MCGLAISGRGDSSGVAVDSREDVASTSASQINFLFCSYGVSDCHAKKAVRAIAFFLVSEVLLRFLGHLPISVWCFRVAWAKERVLILQLPKHF